MSVGRRVRTRNHITSIHRIFVFDETETIHELDLRDLARAMRAEVVLNIGLGSYKFMVQSAMPDSWSEKPVSRPASSGSGQKAQYHGRANMTSASPDHEAIPISMSSVIDGPAHTVPRQVSQVKPADGTESQHLCNTVDST